MQIWPVDYDGAWTLAGAITRAGVGLHSGVDVSVTLLPSDRPGYWVSWDDDSSAGPVQLAPSQVRDSQLCTTLDFGERRLATVEHLLAALAGTGITHAELRVSGAEVPSWMVRPWLGGGDRRGGPLPAASPCSRPPSSSRW